MIPARIMQTLVDETTMDRPEYARWSKQFKDMHPGYNIVHYTNVEQATFVEEHAPVLFEQVYQRLPTLIQKCDFFRLMEIYINGGFYFDLDIEPIRSLDDLRKHTLVFPIEELISNQIYQDEKGLGRYRGITHTEGPFARIGQYAFAAVPGHPFIYHAIQDIADEIDWIVESETTTENYEYWIYATTATDRITRSVVTHQPEDITLLEYPNYGIREADRLMYPLYFGNYAKHWCHGSWKESKTR